MLSYSERLRKVVIARSPRRAGRRGNLIGLLHFVRNDPSLYDNLFKPFQIATCRGLSDEQPFKSLFQNSDGLFCYGGPTPIGCLILFEGPHLVGEANKVKAFNSSHSKYYVPRTQIP